MSRLFVAAFPPAEVLDSVAALDRPDVAGVRWTKREQWHVTLRFLGEANEHEAVTALRSLVAAPVMAEVGPRVSKLGRGVVVVAVAGLDAVAAGVQAATEHVGQPSEKRPFRAHLTLARTKGNAKCPLIGAPLEACFDIDEVHLVRSDLRPQGARYEVVSSVELKNSATGTGSSAE